jgi:diadenosine tetraphosphate (Ap4A) HIT family hydrolase
MNESENGCPFCDVQPDRIIAENGLAFALMDKYPVSPGHLLVCPRRHVASFLELTPGETAAIFELVHEAKSRCDVEFHPAGYNVGVNIGHAAGQTVMHVHVHLIPRYDGDVEDPTGGVRNVIPGKGNYLGFGVTERTPRKRT